MNNKTKYFLLVFSILLLNKICFSNIDSLFKVENIHTLFQKREYFNKLQIELKSNPYNQEYNKVIKLIEIAKYLKNDTFLIQANLNLALYYTNKTQLDSSIDVYLKNIELIKKLNLNESLMKNYLGLGINYGRMSQYDKSINAFINSLKIAEKIKNRHGEASAYNNIGIVEYQMKNYDKALEFHLKSIRIKKEINDTLDLSFDYQNIAGVYFDNGEFEKSLEYSIKSYNLVKNKGDLFGECLSLISIGLNKKQLKLEDEALKLFLSADSLNSYVKDDWLNVTIANSLGSLYLSKFNFIDAEVNFEKSLPIAKKYKMFKELSEVYSGLAECYEHLNQPYKSINYYKQYNEIKDSIYNKTKLEQINELESKYQSEKQEAQITLLNKNKELNESKIKEQQLVEYVFALIILTLIAIAFFIFRNLTQKRKANKLISEQKDLVDQQNEELNQINEEILAQRDQIETQKIIVEEKNLEILSSIEYAKRIQTAILPSKNQVDKEFNNFILYKPKDIVAGDFFWFDKIEECIFIAAADCTGHGVPGAMVSVVCHNALNRAVREFNLKTSGKILDKTRELVIETFEKSEEQVKDGMDISLCVFNVKSNSIQFSGANNPLYIYRNKFKKIDILKGDKQPIGLHFNPKNFTTNILELTEGDQLFLFTDGYADQFGGKSSKKLGYQKFRELLQENIEKPLPIQKERLEFFLAEWQGNDDQIDDICIISIKL